MDSRKIRVVIADDERLALDGLAGIVEKIEGFELTGKADDGAKALDIIRDKGADILLTDIKMPNRDGMWLITSIEELNLPVTCIMVSAYDDEKYIRAAIRNSHVYDYIFKPFMSEEVRELLNAAAIYHRRRQYGSGISGINMNLLFSCIMQHNTETLTHDIDIYFNNTELPLSDLKNLAYGWVMTVHNTIMASLPTASLMHESDIMNSIYNSQSKQEIRDSFMVYIGECSDRYVNNDEVTPIVSAALQIIHNEMGNPDLNLNYAAAKLEVTPNYLSGRFSRDMRQSFSNYLTHYRINSAKELLTHINRKVYEVSLDVGFTDVSYFTRVFREHVGMTPLQYRQQVITMESSDSTSSATEIE